MFYEQSLFIYSILDNTYTRERERERERQRQRDRQTDRQTDRQKG